MTEDFLTIYDAARVMRLHTVADYSGARALNLAEHQWGVAVLCDYLSAEKASAALFRAALLHDIAEAWLGDPPTPAKWRFPYLADAYDRAEDEIKQTLAISVTLTREEQTVLRWADALELMTYCLRRGGAAYLAIAERINDAMTGFPPLVSGEQMREELETELHTMLKEY